MRKELKKVYCQYCDEEIKYNGFESTTLHNKRKFCNRSCMAESFKIDTREKHILNMTKYYEVDKKTGCWNWTGGKCEKGYGLYRFSQKSIRAHRASYQLRYNIKIPRNKMACHKCDNPSCVNPDHIFIGTGKDNHNDMVRKGRYRIAQGENSGSAKLNNEKAIDIYLSKAPTKELAKKYNVCETTIRDIRRGQKWRCAIEQFQRVND